MRVHAFAGEERGRGRQRWPHCHPISPSWGPAHCPACDTDSRLCPSVQKRCLNAFHIHCGGGGGGASGGRVEEVVGGAVGWLAVNTVARRGMPLFGQSEWTNNMGHKTGPHESPSISPSAVGAPAETDVIFVFFFDLLQPRGDCRPRGRQGEVSSGKLASEHGVNQSHL